MTLLCAPWSEHRVLHDADGVLAVDKPAGWVVHGGDRGRADDCVGRLGAWLDDRGDDPYLAVHQRLDKDASGVLAFVRDRALNAAVSADVEDHSAHRVYVAVVEGAIDGKGVFEDRIETSPEGHSIVVGAGGRRSVARYRVIERDGARALVELELVTGRTHQLRVQLSHRESPICGDRLYGGVPAPRLMLHARRLHIPSLDLTFEAPVPDAFRACLGDRADGLPGRGALARRVADALAARWAIARTASAFRIADDVADGLPGATLDRYGDWVVLSTSSAAAFDRTEDLAGVALAAGARGVYLKTRRRADLRKLSAEELAPAAPIAGESAPAPLEVAEGPLRYAVDLSDGLSTGLFLDQRDNRRRVMELADGARVLNLFCYTGSFTVAAARGGARETISVDLSKKALSRLAQNLELNGLAGDCHALFRQDASKWLGRARRRGERFDLVVLDPPSFATKKSGTFSFDKDYRAVAADALAVTSPGGHLLAVTNYRKIDFDGFRRVLRDAARAAGCDVRQLKNLSGPLDHPHRPDGIEPTKSVLLTLS